MVKMFDDDDEVDEVADAGFKVNESFAKRFEHNEERKELHRLQAKHPEKAVKYMAQALRNKRRGDEEYEEESSSSEEEDDGFIAPDTEADIADTLLRIKRKDPSIYKKDIHFFKELSDDDEGDDAPKGDQPKKEKPLYLKDVLARQLLEHGPEGDLGEDGEDAAPKKPAKAYDAEQEKLRKAFLKAFDDDAVGTGGDGAFGGVLAKRAPRQVESDDDDGDGDDGADGVVPAKAKPGKKEKKLWSEYFEAQDPSERFLKDFILTRGWVDKSDDVPSYNEVVGDEEGGDDEEDEEHLQQMDRFEAAYNFRFEEPGGTNIVGHPRVIEGTIRKEDTRRKKGREEKATRLAEVEDRNKEEVKRLKNLKRKEIEDKVKLLQRVAGPKSVQDGMMDDMLEGDFDPEEWDKKMAAAFGDDFYDQEVAEDEEEQAIFDDSVVTAQMGKLVEDEDGEKEPEINARDIMDEAQLNKLLDEYYKLDYEGTAGGLRTRFRYKQVPMQQFGLSLDEIVRHSDKDLNTVIGMKRLAPYREDTGRMKPNYKALEALKAGTAEDGIRKKQRKQQKQSAGAAQDKPAEQSTQQAKPKDNKKQPSENKPQGGQQEGKKRARDNTDGGGNKVKAEPGSAVAGKKGKETGGQARKRIKENKNSDGSSKGGKEDTAGDPAAARLASYARLSLGKDKDSNQAGSKAKGGSDSKGGDKKKDTKTAGGDGKGKSQGGAAPAPVAADGPVMSKAAKKNKRRDEKRARKVAQGSGGAAAK